MSLDSRPYGTWKSDFSAATAARAGIRFGQTAIYENELYWLEGRPEEGGRSVLMRVQISAGETKHAADHKLSAPQEILSEQYNVRTRAHEYGGGAYVVDASGIYFVHDADGCIYYARHEEFGAFADPIALTHPGPYRYADLLRDPLRQRLICIRETVRKGLEELSEIVALGLNEKEMDFSILESGADFYASPRLSPDARTLVWLQWNHPDMPWDAAALYGAKLGSAKSDESGSPGRPYKICGGENESIFQPEFSPDGELFFVSDRDQWQRIFRGDERGVHEVIDTKEIEKVEFGLPQWIFGMSTYGFIDSEHILCTYNDRGRWNLARIDLQNRKLQGIDAAFTHISDLHVGKEFAVFIGAGEAKSSGPHVYFHASEKGAVEKCIEKKCITLRLRSEPQHNPLHDPENISRPQTIEFPTGEGNFAHGFYFPPTNPLYVAPTDELPPLIVKCHGGPTHATIPVFNAEVQYWTSRGFAIFDLNYRGSTGYGRRYRDSLHTRWGVADAEDAGLGAHYLASKGLADPERLIISGGSAGGYTVLCALSFRNEFAAGAVRYGISDLEALVRHTHKFEARYLDRLVAPYPEGKNIYRGRSPLYHAQGITCPVIFFQGLEDKVVPPEQSERMYDALKKNGIYTQYVPFAGEQHGFRRAESIIAMLEKELDFYLYVFDISI